MFKYRLKRLSRPKVIFWSAFILLFFVSMSSIVRFYAADLSSHSSYGVSRIEGDTVIVNDLDADWYYYEGLNFTEITSRTVLPGEKRNVYNEDTLAMVQINYIGTDPNGNGWTGYVSKTERQSNFTYYKYYPIDANGYIEIELIDNPYTLRPKHPDYSTGTNEYRAFNGWICNKEESGEGVCDNLTFYHDYDYYVRTAKIKVDASKKVLLTLNASWTDAYVFGGRSDENVLKIGMYAIPGFHRTEAVYGHPCNYTFKSGFDFYELVTTTNNSEPFSGYLINFSTSTSDYSLKYVENYTCPDTTCTYLTNKQGTTYNLGTHYFEKTGATEQSIEIQKVIKKQIVDEEGNPVLDADDNPLYEGDIVDDGTLLYKEVEVEVEVPITLHKFVYTTYNQNTNNTYIKKYYNYKLCENTSYSTLEEKVGDAVVSDIFDYGSSLNWYYYKDSNYDTSKKNLYYNASGQRCDMSGVTCNTTNGVYRLVQSWDDEIGTWKNRVYTDDNGVIKIENNTKVGNYYYLVTRDTNIIIHNTRANGNGNDSSYYYLTNSFTQHASNQPFTLTCDNTNYYQITLTDASSDFEPFKPNADLVLENLIIRTSKGDSTSDDYERERDYDDGGYSIIPNYTNIKISRTVKANGSYKVARTIFAASTSYSNQKARYIIEAGDYNQIYGSSYYDQFNWNGESRNQTNNHLEYILGSDYDRASNIHSNLRIYHRFVGGSYDIMTNNTLTPSTDVVVKSGTFGERTDDTYSGIYVGMMGTGYNRSSRSLIVEGGVIHHVIGGLRTYNISGGQQYCKINLIGIYVKGGKITNIIGGAGTTETCGNRIISVTSGTVRHAVIGGSNSYDGTQNPGPLNGNTLVYIGGNAILGDGTTPKYEIPEDGSVYGAGLGNSNNSQYGIVNSSHVIINGATINGSVYGGGNYGSAGGATTDTTSTKIDIFDGNIASSVYGGANSNGAGKGAYANCHTEYCLRSNSSRYIYTYGGKVNRNAYYPNGSYKTNNTKISNSTTKCTTSGGCAYYLRRGDYTDYYPDTTYYYYSSGFKTISPTKVLNSFNHDVTINMYGGNVNGSVYGGSKSTGYIYGDVDINLYGGKVTKSVYGGGYGKPTRIMGSVDIDTDTDDNTLLNVGNIYGGSALGVVNPGSVNTYTDIKVNGGTIGSVYGGGEGNTSTTPYTDGSIKVSILSGKIGNVFGGTNVNGSVPYPNKSLDVYVTGGTITNVFGGSNGTRASAGNTYVGIAGGTISNVYGGGNEAVVNGSTVVDIGTLKVDVDTIDSNLSSIPGAVIGNVYGGGNKASVSVSTDVDITHGNIQNAFGGGNEATVPTSNISITGGSIELALYGGGNKAKVNTTTVDVLGGTFTQLTEKQGMGLGIFGGGANVSDSGADNTTVNLKSGVNVYNVYGGSNVSGTVTGTTKVIAESVNVGCNLYGGGFQAAVNNSNVSVTGSSTLSYTLTSNENAYNATCGMVFGGGASADVTGTANLTFDTTGKAVTLYGGSNKAGNVENTNVIVKKGVVSAVFGGNNYDGATFKSNVEISKGSGVLRLDNVYGGSNGKNAIIGKEDANGIYELGATTVKFTSGKINENIFGGGNEAPVYGTTDVVMVGGEVNRVYGGGNKAFIGDDTTFDLKFADNVASSARTGTAISNVNISGGIVNDNVYGSGNASFVDGDTFVNIANASTTSTTTKSLEIGGSIFGGSETNADEDKTFNYKSIGVSGESTIVIDGENYLDSNNKSTLILKGSVYGGGNNSATRETAKLYMNKVGTKRSPMSMASIQRLQYVYIKDSSIELNGARDRTSEKRYTYGFVRVNDLYLLGTETTGSSLNGSDLYMVSGNTFLGNYHSGIVPDEFEVGYDIREYYDPQEVVESNGDIVPVNSDNEIYMYENVVFAVSDSDEIKYDSSAGQVEGMTYLGMYNHGRSGNKLTLGYFDSIEYSEGKDVRTTDYNAITQTAYTFAYGRNDYKDMVTQVKKHGFYTNNVKVEGDKKTIDVDYVPVRPKDNFYYQWLIGVVPKIIPVDLEATRYSTQGAKNVMITLDELKEATGKDWKDATMVINRVDTSLFKPKSDDLRNGIEYETELVDKSEIASVNVNDENNDGVVDANNYFALSMGTITSGWLNNYKTNIYENEYLPEDSDLCKGDSAGDCSGDIQYVYDSTDIQRGLTFWLHHSKNLDFSVSNANDRENAIITLGKIVIETVFRNPHADPTSANREVTVFIEINVTMSDSTRDGYGKAIAPGTKYTVFDSISTSIPTTGAFSIYQSLSLDLTRPMISDESKIWDVNDLYGVAETKDGVVYSESYRYLASNYLFPIGTKVTMLDLVTDEQYYYEVTRDNRDAISAEANGSSEYRYRLEEFIRMGSTSSDNKYDDDMNGENSKKYYTHDGNIKVAVEEFIFNVDFSNVDPDNISVDEAQTFYLFMQLSRDENGSEKVKLAPTGVPVNEMVYTLNPTLSSTLTTTGGFIQDGTDELSPATTIYVNEAANLRLKTMFKQNIVGTTDTTYDDYKLGAKITIKRPSKDANGNIIEGSYENITDDLFGIVFTINGKKYYPQIDGVTRIELAGRVSNVDSDINIDFSNSDLIYGDYVIFVETFASYDGLYYGDADLVECSFPITLLNNQYGLNVTIPPVQITHDVNSGLDKNGDKKITYSVNTKNGVSNPYLRISLERRNYSNDSVFDTTYTNLDFKNIATIINIGTDSSNISATNILDNCYLEKDGVCSIYTLTQMDSSKASQDFVVEMTLKDGPTASDLLDLSKSGWKSGTYKVVFTLYDGDVPVGSVFEYLIIRSLDVDEIIERS